jgi:hypothetical protein
LAIALFTFSIVYLNLELVEYVKPPISWYINTKIKCVREFNHYVEFFLGLKETFFDTAILICLPTVVFGVSFAIGVEPENMKWTKTSFSKTIVRLVLGLLTVGLIDFWFSYLSLDLIDHVSLYVWKYLFKYAASTFFVYGIMPTMSEILNISRTSYIKTRSTTSEE